MSGKRSGAGMRFRTAEDAGVTIVPKDKLGRRFWQQALDRMHARRKANRIAETNAANFDARPRLIKNTK
jgi:hypothetical protein